MLGVCLVFEEKSVFHSFWFILEILYSILVSHFEQKHSLVKLSFKNKNNIFTIYLSYSMYHPVVKPVFLPVLEMGGRNGYYSWNILPLVTLKISYFSFSHSSRTVLLTFYFDHDLFCFSSFFPDKIVSSLSEENCIL